MRSWILSLTAAALLALTAPIYALWADTPPGNPSDPADQPTVPASEQPANDTGEVPAAADAPTGAQAPGGASAAPPAAATQAEVPDRRLAAVLPPATSRQDACSGFKSGAECLAALHAAQNLGIPFADLKSKLAAGERLTSAVRELKPGADAKAEVRKAEEQAHMDMRQPRG